MLKVNSVSNIPVVYNAQAKKTAPTLSKYNLQADTVTFTSLNLLAKKTLLQKLFGKKTMLDKVVAYFKPETTMLEVAEVALKYTSQVASLIGSAIAISALFV